MTSPKIDRTSRTGPRRRTLWSAGLASFLVYLTPVVGPHALFTVAGVLAVDVASIGTNKEVAWVAADVAAALALQAIAFGLLVWVMSGRRRRWLAVLPAIVAGTWAANLAYMVVIPTRFLLEPDTAPERASWPVECVVENASLLDVRSGAEVALGRAGEVWIQQEPGGIYGVLRMPQCRVSSTRHRRSATTIVDYVSPGAGVLLRSRDPASNVETHWLDLGDGAAPVEVPKPGEEWWNPTLSADARVIAWIESEPGGSGRRPVHRVVTRSLESGAEQRFTLPERLASRRQILSLSAGTLESDRQVLLLGGDNLLAAFDTQGNQTWGPASIPELIFGVDAVRRLGDGWVAWDGYREQGRYRVHWSLERGRGQHEVLKGRSINDVAVDASGRFIAVSVTNALNLGSVDDAVYVLRVEDGEEVYRRYLDRFNRTPVAFISSQFLVFHRIATVDGRIEVTVDVVRVPSD